MQSSSFPEMNAPGMASHGSSGFLSNKVNENLLSSLIRLVFSATLIQVYKCGIHTAGQMHLGGTSELVIQQMLIKCQVCTRPGAAVHTDPALQTAHPGPQGPAGSATDTALESPARGHGSITPKPGSAACRPRDSGHGLALFSCLLISVLRIITEHL